MCILHLHKQIDKLERERENVVQIGDQMKIAGLRANSVSNNDIRNENCVLYEWRMANREVCFVCRARSVVYRTLCVASNDHVEMWRYTERPFDQILHELRMSFVDDKQIIKMRPSPPFNSSTLEVITVCRCAVCVCCTFLWISTVACVLNSLFCIEKFRSTQIQPKTKTRFQHFIRILLSTYSMK